MIKKITGMAALCLALGTQPKAQDFDCGAIGFTSAGLNRTIRIKILNQGKKEMRPLQVSIQLHTNSQANNPIAQLCFSAAVLEKFQVQIVDVRLADFRKFRAGFCLQDATKIVVVCNPIKEVKEINDNNNTTSKI